MRLLHFYYADRDSPKGVASDLVEWVLFHPTLFTAPEPDTKGAHLDFDWSLVARQFLLQAPRNKLPIVKRLLESMGEESVVLPRYTPSESNKLLTELSKELPREMWKVAAPLLGPPIDARAYSIKNWLSGERDLVGQSDQNAEKITSILHSIPPEDLWAWVDVDPEQRAWYLASFVPKDLLLHPETTSLAREPLIRYGDREDVSQNLMANFSSEGWMGLASAHYGSKIRRLERALTSETEPNVREWLNRYIRGLEHSVERTRTEEERERR